MAQETKPTTDQEDSIPFYPDHVRTEVKVMLGITVIVGIIAVVGLFFPVGLGEPADPMNTPLHVKPEWYFLWLYQLLKYVPKLVGVLIPVVGVVLLILWPFLDRKPDTTSRAQRIRFGLAIAAVLLIVILTIWGELS